MSEKVPNTSAHQTVAERANMAIDNVVASGNPRFDTPQKAVDHLEKSGASDISHASAEEFSDILKNEFGYSDEQIGWAFENIDSSDPIARATWAEVYNKYKHNIGK